MTMWAGIRLQQVSTAVPLHCMEPFIDARGCGWVGRGRRGREGEEIVIFIHANCTRSLFEL